MSFEFVSGINATTPIAIVEKADDAKSTEEHMADYIESMKALEDAMEPFKEQKRDLKANYVENGWLTKEDIWSAVKALRMYQKSADLDAVNEMFDIIEKKFGPKEEV